jgi:excinuclease ABC subunit B
MPTRSPARWSARWPRPTAAAPSSSPTTRNTASRRNRSRRNIADILDSVYERDHVRADIPGGKGVAADEGALIGANLKAHLKALEKQMRDAAADLDFETAARLRDEIKRLKAVELDLMDDPMARDTGR